MQIMIQIKLIHLILGKLDFKDTIISYPDEITRVLLKFDIPGRFVWHCHLLEHEDSELMRPILVSA